MQEQILQNNGIQLINDIRANMGSAGLNATGDTSNSLRIEISQKGSTWNLKLLGRAFFMTVQTGRKPTPGKKPGRDMIERITRWVEARDLPLSAVWGIATNIQNKGTKLWQTGGREDIVDPAIDDFVNNTSQEILQNIGDELLLKVRKEWS